MSNPVIVNAVRTPVGKARKGTLVNYRPDDLAAHAMKALLERTPALDPAEIGDIVFGCAEPEAEQGVNVANIAKFAAGIPFTVPAVTLNRMCASGLQSIAFANDSIVVGRHEVTIGGGCESMTMVPMGGHKISPNPDLMDTYPEVYTTMGLTAERVAEKYGVTREEQDQYAYESNMRAVQAIKDKKFEDETVPISFEQTQVGPDGKPTTKTIELTVDEGPRADTTLEALTGLRTPFKQKGTVTAGNASQMSDGAACVLLMSEEKAKALKLKPLARLVGYTAAGVEPELMGIGPMKAVPKVLELTGLKLDDIGLIELNEAFAAQTLAVIKELGLNREITNVNGGAIALGHPLGATGAILTVRMIHEMRRRKVKYGLVTMCVGGGMGGAGVMENPDA